MNKLEAVESKQFVVPTPKAELEGQLGLSVEEIATSLGAEPKHVRQKLRDRGMIDRINACNFKTVTVTTLHPINGSEYEDFILDVNAARFFLAKYDNEIGDGYLTYLIHLENKITEITTEQLLALTAQRLQITQKEKEDAQLQTITQIKIVNGQRTYVVRSALELKEERDRRYKAELDAYNSKQDAEKERQERLLAQEVARVAKEVVLKGINQAPAAPQQFIPTFVVKSSALAIEFPGLVHLALEWASTKAFYRNFNDAGKLTGYLKACGLPFEAKGKDNTHYFDRDIVADLAKKMGV